MVSMRKLPTGEMAVYENADYRWLSIDDTIQTAMSLSTPSALALPHLHGLALLFYLKPRWRSLLELGLGGGAMSRFVTQYQPDCRLTSVELSEAIIEVYQQHFCTPNALHHVVCADANEFVKMNTERHDAIIVDLFSGNQSPDFLLDTSFYNTLWHSVSDDGVIALNIIAHAQVYFDALLDCVMASMPVLPLCFSIPGYKNKILILSREAIKPFDYQLGLIGFAQQHQLDLNHVMPLNLKRYRSS